MRSIPVTILTGLFAIGFTGSVWAKDGTVRGNTYISSDKLISVSLPPTHDSIFDSAKKPGKMAFVEFCYDCNYPMMDTFYSLEWFKLQIPASKNKKEEISTLFTSLPAAMNDKDLLARLAIKQLNKPTCNYINLHGEQAYQCITTAIDNPNHYFCATTIIRNDVLLNAYFVLPEDIDKTKQTKQIPSFDAYKKFLESIQINGA